MVAQDQSSSYQGQYQNFSLTLRSEKIAVIQRQAEKVERMFKNLLQLDAKVNRLLQQQNQSFHDELEQQLEQQNHIFEVRFNRLQKNGELKIAQVKFYNLTKKALTVMIDVRCINYSVGAY